MFGGHGIIMRGGVADGMTGIMTSVVLLTAVLSGFHSVRCHFCEDVGSALAEAKAANLIVKHAVRTIDLRGRNPLFIYELTVENQGVHPVDRMYIPAVEFSGSQSPPENPSGKTVRACAVEGGGYVIELTKGLVSNHKEHIELHFYTFEALRPLPKAVPMTAYQRVTFDTRSTILLPYFVESQRTIVKLSKSGIERFRPKDIVQSSDKDSIYFKTVKNVKAYEQGVTVFAHYPLLKHLGEFDKVIRTITLSEYSHVGVQEYYSFTNRGAEVTDGFNRNVISQLTGQIFGSLRNPRVNVTDTQRNFAISLDGRLPSVAYGVEYYDRIGNISSSHAWREAEEIRLQLEPRYPVVGGWSADWMLDYKLPLKSALSVDRTRLQSLSHRLNLSLSDIYAKEVVTRVILPSGSSQIQLHVPRETSPVTTGTSWQWLQILFPSKTIEFTIKEHMNSLHNAKDTFQVTFMPSYFSSLQKLLSCFLVSAVPFIIYLTNARVKGIIIETTDERRRRLQLQRDAAICAALCAIVAKAITVIRLTTRTARAAVDDAEINGMDAEKLTEILSEVQEEHVSSAARFSSEMNTISKDRPRFRSILRLYEDVESCVCEMLRIHTTVPKTEDGKIVATALAKSFRAAKEKLKCSEDKLAQALHIEET